MALGQDGQAMTEYVIVAAFAVIVLTFGITRAFVPYINTLYEMITGVVGLPFP